MNWERGLFRSWVILSSAWAAVVAVIHVEELSQPPTLTQVEHNPFQKPPALPPGFELESVPKTTPVTDPKILAQLNANKPKWPETPLASEAYQQYPRRTTGEILVSASTIAFVPSLILLVVGAGVLWAAKGFRSKE